MSVAPRARKQPPLTTIWAMVALNLVIAPFNIYETLHNPGGSPVWVVASFAAAVAMIWGLCAMIRGRYAKAPASGAAALQALVPTP